MTWDRGLWLLAGLSLPLIILFHLLARRRRELTVPSLLLWRRVLENEKPSLRFRRLVADFLLILQLTTAALTVIALAGPRLTGNDNRITGPSVIVIDVSAGMSAADEDGRVRLEDARNEAIRLVKGKALNSDMAILAGGATIRPISGFTRSRRELLDALRGLEGSDEAGDPGLSLRAATALASSRRGSRTIFITDGAFDSSPGFGSGVETIIVGTAVENAGITLMDIRNLPGGGKELILAGQNFGTRTRNLHLAITLDGRELMGESFLLGAGERVSRNLVWQDNLEGRLEASLTGEEADALTADDRAYAVLSPDSRTRVILYTTENWFLETLLSSHPGLDLEVRRRGSGEAVFDPPPEDADILVLDRVAPPLPAATGILAIYPFEGSNPGLPLGIGPVVSGSSPVAWDNDHPVMQDVDLSRVSISRSVLMDPVPGTRVLAESGNGPLILCGDEGNRRWTALSFDLLASSLPINPAFPILFSNTLDWLAPGDTDSGAFLMRSGSLWRLPVSSSVEELQVVDPRGEPVAIDPGSDSIVPGRVGFWAVLMDRTVLETGVNLLDAGESDLQPRWLPDTVFDAASDAEAEDPITRPVRPGLLSPASTIPHSRPLLTILLLSALAAMFGEWAVQTRTWRRR